MLMTFVRIFALLSLCLHAFQGDFSNILGQPSAILYGMAKDVPSYKHRPITDDIIYFVMVDRFADGDPSNNRGDFVPAKKNTPDRDSDILEHGYWPQNKGYYLGGDFKGLTSKLDYLKDMGITAIWLSPVLKNQPVQRLGTLKESHSGYHGYWITDFTTVDPHFGTEDEFNELLAEAHKRNMKVFMDIIVNHTADIIRYKECTDCSYRNTTDYPYQKKRATPPLNPKFNPEKDGKKAFDNLINPNYAYTPYVPENLKSVKKPSWLNDPIYYHNRGNSTFSGENSQLGDFYGLDDLFTENPKVVEGMIEIYKDLMSRFEIDGFRMDTVKHVNIEFWQEFVPEILNHAKALKRPEFYVFGEVYSSEPETLGYYVRNGKMEATLDFAIQAAIKSVVAEGDQRSAFQKVHNKDDLYRLSTSPQKLPTFASNHDMGRIGHFIQSAKQNARPDELLKRSLLAQSLLYFSRGVPVLYYGDEQGFTGDGGDKDAREPMFPSKVKSYNDNILIGTNKTTAESNFDIDHPIYRTLKHYAEIYQQHPTLRRGEQVIDESISDNANVYAFSRIGDENSDDYLVAYNFGNSTQSIDWKGRPSIEIIYASHLEEEDSFENIRKTPSRFEIPALSFIILKGAKSKASKLATLGINQEKQQISISSPKPGDLVSGLVNFTADLPEHLKNSSGDFTVKFYYKLSQQKEWSKLYSDPTPPYQGFLDTESIKQGEIVNFKAQLYYRKSEQLISETETYVRVDGRKPVVNVFYENGNQRTHAFFMSTSGSISVLKQLEGKQQFQFQWPQKDPSVTILYGQKQGSGLSFDRPLALKFEKHIKASLISGKKSLKADIYINNKGEISGEKNWVGDKFKPKKLLQAKESKANKMSDNLYVRGGMNTWEAKDKLNYVGNGTYQSELELPSGKVDFKIADAQWSGPSNFGSPIREDSGLTASSQSGNLSITIPHGQQGSYRLRFIRALQDEHENINLSFVTIEALNK